LEAYGNLRLIGTLPLEGFSTNLLKLLLKEFYVPVATAIRTLSKSSKEIKALTKLITFIANDKSIRLKLLTVLIKGPIRMKSFTSLPLM